MNIDKMKSQHIEIMAKLNKLRELSHAGVSQHAKEIAQTVISMSSVIKIHLCAEDRFLYPYLKKVNDAELKRMSAKLQCEMADIITQYEAFSRRWNTAEKVSGHDEAFRRDANTVLRQVHERMHKEDHEFYPLVEQI